MTKKGYIYKLWLPDTDDIYIGSTESTLSKRLAGHRYSYKRYLNGQTNYVSSFKLIENINCRIEMIEIVNFNDRTELLAREGHHIRENKNCINRCVAGRSHEQWYEENKEYVIERGKKYYLENKEIVKNKVQEYREINKEKVKESLRRSHEKHKEVRNAKRREKIVCECGDTITRGVIARHKQTKRHIELMKI